MGPEHTRPREAARKCKAKQRAEQDYTKLGQGRPGQAAFGEIFQRMSHPPKKNSNLSTPTRQQVVAKKLSGKPPALVILATKLQGLIIITRIFMGS